MSTRTQDEKLPVLWDRFYEAFKQLRAEFSKSGGSIEMQIQVRDAAAEARYQRRLASRRKSA